MDNGTQPYTEYGGEWTVAGAVEDHGTSHLSVVDAERNAVSFTTTINTSFGAKLLSESTGMLLPSNLCVHFQPSILMGRWIQGFAHHSQH